MSSQKRYCCAIPRSQRGIVSALNEKGIDMAIASCSSADNTIKSLLEKFGLQSMFVTKEVFTSSCHKKEHFQKIRQGTGVAYQFMLFFDEGPANIDTVSKLGVSSTLVKKGGFNLETFRLGLENVAANSRN